MLLILVFTLIAALAWLSTTGYWDRNGDMFRGYAIALVIIVHLIAFVAALVVPGAEVRVVVLAAQLEKVRVVRYQLRDHPGAMEVVGNRVFPDFDGTPGPPEKVQSAAKDVVTGWHAGE